MTAPRARPWIWRKQGARTPGVLIRSGAASVFIPGKHLRRIADVLHDEADHLEEEDR